MRIEINEAAERLDELVDLALAGKTVLFTRNGIPVARLVPAEAMETSHTDAVAAEDRQDVMQAAQDEGERLVMRAREMARSCHAGQCDKLGIDYFHHLKDVATRVASMPGATDEMIAAAWLHDAVEDDRATPEEVLAATSAEVVRLVALLTRPGYISYARYVARVALDPAASRIKLADLCHNRGKAHLLEDYAARASLRGRYDRAIAAILELNPALAGYATVIDLVPTREGWVAATR